MFWIAVTMAAAFTLELVLCLKADSVMKKMAPICVVLAVMLVLAVLFTEGALKDFTWMGFGADVLLAAAFFWGVALVVAMLLAWPVYIAMDYVRKKRMPAEE